MLFYNTTRLLLSQSRNVNPVIAVSATAAAAVTGMTVGTVEKIQCRTVSTVVVNSNVSRVSQRFNALLYNNNTNRIVTESIQSRSLSSSTSTSSSTSSSAAFVEWYEGHLLNRPIPTKMVTGGILWGLGDAVGQTVPKYAAGESIGEYDFIRTARASFFGCCIHAPTSHVHYNFLEWMTIKGGFTGYSIPIFKAFMEQFVYWSWISNSIYHGSMEILTTCKFDPTAIYNRIYDVLWETQKAQWVFWIPVQLVNFQFTPVRHQLNVVLVTSIVWTALLSAWYPPVKENDENKVDEEKKEE